jgi:hypothetical protein
MTRCQFPMPTPIPPSLSRLSRQCGILNISQHYRTPRPVAGIALLFYCIVYFIGPPLWSNGQSSCLQIQRPEFDSRRYQIFWEVVGLERDPLSLVSTIEELLGRNSSGSGLENREYGRRDSSRWQRGTLYPQQLTLTSSTSGGRSVGIVRSRTQAMEFSFIVLYMYFILYSTNSTFKLLYRLLMYIRKHLNGLCKHTCPCYTLHFSTYFDKFIYISVRTM